MFVLFDSNGEPVTGKYQFGSVTHAQNRARKIWGGKLDWETVNDEWHGSDGGKVRYVIKVRPSNPKERDMKKFKAGDKLKNGAVILEHDPATGSVLASWDKGNRTEYVTWRVDDDGNAYWGHYFDSVTDAADDFKKRAKKNPAKRKVKKKKVIRKKRPPRKTASKKTRKKRATTIARKKKKKKVARKSNPDRITKARIKQRLTVLNNMLGTPTEYMTDGKINAFHIGLDQAYGGYRVVQTAAQGSGERDISPRLKAREVYDYIGGMIDGVELHQQLMRRKNPSSRNQLKSKDVFPAAGALGRAFGKEYSGFDAADYKVLLTDFVNAARDEKKTFDEMATVYVRRIGKGNLASYVRTLRAGRRKNPVQASHSTPFIIAAWSPTAKKVAYWGTGGFTLLKKDAKKYRTRSGAQKAAQNCGTVCAVASSRTTAKQLEAALTGKA